MRGSTGIYTYHGRQATLAEISQESGILADTIYSRMKRYGLSAEDAVRMGDKRATCMYMGKEVTIAYIAMVMGIPASWITLAMIREGISAEAAIEQVLGKRHMYCGELLTLNEISERTGIASHKIYACMGRWKKTAEEAVAALQAGEANRNVRGANNAEEAALKIARSIYGGGDPAHTCRFRRTENGNYLFESDFYCCQVWVPDENTARLEVWYKKTGTHSLTRDYAIKA